MLRSIGKQSGESMESVLKKKKKAAVGRIGFLWNRCRMKTVGELTNRQLPGKQL